MRGRASWNQAADRHAPRPDPLPADAGRGAAAPPLPGDQGARDRRGRGGAVASPISRLDQQNGFDLDDYPAGQGAHSNRRASMAAGVAKHLDQKVGTAVDDFRVVAEVRFCVDHAEQLDHGLDARRVRRARIWRPRAVAALPCAPRRSPLRRRRPCQGDRPENCRRAASAPVPRERGGCPPSDTARSWPPAWERPEGSGQGRQAVAQALMSSWVRSSRNAWI